MLTSYQYDFNGVPYDEKDPGSQTWMYARDARAQQTNAPAHKARPYPSNFNNGEKLPLSTPGVPGPKGNQQWLHYPLVPGRAAAWVPTERRGGVRSFYTVGQPNDFDVGYHDKATGTSAGGSGNFVLADYHPSVRASGTAGASASGQHI
ncbi:MAG: hypothetical protein L6R39_004217 [Caloplaca ligustica]|nr:MAG: hypothetical protein L6R39_004217 [Caloplaca ligustica]